MKHIILLILLLNTSILTFGQETAIEFDHADFIELKARATKEDKLIFIDAYTTWCGPCKYMAAKIFIDKDVADFYNKNFINAKIDMEKGEGIELAKKYEVQCYPTLLFIDGKGKLIHRISGSMNPQDFIELGKVAKQPTNTFSYFVSNYEANKNNSEFMLKYIDAREATCLSSEEITHKYFDGQKNEDLFSKTNWEIIQKHVYEMDSKPFKFFIENKEKYTELYSQEAVVEKIDAVSQYELDMMLRSKSFNEEAYSNLKSKIKAFNSPNITQLFFESDLRLAAKKNNWTLYADLAKENVDKFLLNDANMLNSIAWNFYEKVDDVDALQYAEKWIRKACEIENEYALLDTHAAILYKLKKKDLALAKAKEAIEKAKVSNYKPEDYKGTSELIEKINKL